MKQKVNKKTEWIIIGLLAISAQVLFHPLYDHRFFWSHDEAQLLWRITALHANIIHGAPLCRWFPDFARGLGLPFLEFFPVLFLFLTEIFKFPGFGTIVSAKLSIITVTILGSFFAYCLAKEFWGRWGGLLSGLLYTYIPYRIFDLYVRGDVNEYTAISLLPLNLWIIFTSARQTKPQWISIPMILGMGALSVTHYPSAVIQFPVYAIWILLLAVRASYRVPFLFQSSASTLLGLAVTSPWWASAFLSRHLVQMEGMTQGFANYQEQFIHPLQWISTYWNFGASVKGAGDTVSFQIGNVAILFMLAGFPAIYSVLKKTDLSAMAIYSLTGIGIISLFLMTGSSDKVWQTIPLLPLLQFPYRLLQIPALVVSVLGGALAPAIIQRFPRSAPWILTGSGAVVLLFSVNMCRVGAYLNLSETELTSFTISRVSHTHCTGEFIPVAVGKRFPPKSPMSFQIEKIPENGFTREQMEQKLSVWLQKAPDVEYWTGETMQIGNQTIMPQTFDVLSGNAVITQQTGLPIDITCSLSATEATRIRFNQFYFEGWAATVNGTEMKLFPDPDTGMIAFDVPAGRHSIQIRYRNLPLSRTLEKLTLTFCLLLVAYGFHSFRKKVVH